MTRSYRPVLDDLLEHHEVGDEDLVHAAQRLEAVQIVPAGLRRDVADSEASQALAGWIAFARASQDRCHRVLREPVDLERRAGVAQLAGDREVAAGVTEADRRRDIEDALWRAVRAGSSGCATGAGRSIDEIA